MSYVYSWDSPGRQAGQACSTYGKAVIRYRYVR